MATRSSARIAARRDELLLRIGVLGSCILGQVSCSGEEGNPADASGSPHSEDGSLEISDDALQDRTGEIQGGLDEDGICRDLTVEDGCSGQVFEGEAVPADLYLMFDQSGSMSTIVDAEEETTRIDVVRAAVRAFLSDDESVGLGAGIGYFGHQPLGETSCSSEDYATPDVEIGPLPGAADALMGSLDSREPTGETPTASAIRGACDHVSRFTEENPGRNPAILLVTDGEPKAPLSQETCSPTLGEAIEEATRCFEEEGIRVYVLGVGPSLSNLRLIAEAGGTEEAFLADTDNADEVLSALRAVRGAAQLPCEIELAEDAFEDLDPDEAEVTLAYLDLGCSYVGLERVEDESGCRGDAGFFLDDPEEPRRLHLCESTCDDLKSTGRQLYYSVGCPLQVVR